ncbi:hypothetical protein MKK70_27925 [Methylobacterium sp. E-041]|jgi:hypothetical protein|uniref:hypothetical protein n=1 Tax=unclassified Methylobacterium TaxID=2615210 RepID=UPI001FBB3EB6|nr:MULTISPECIES: hypothetical protein [unclassified Methylobacterium]MCJ2109131.1 hypothetical protein [Methylobacterium sp. E-041]MCJ2110439.1 hypothetical protein [Methylobacterium sp. E-025]
MIFTDRPPGIGPDIHVEDGRAWVADGLGIVTNGVLCVTGPELSADEWAGAARQRALMPFHRAQKVKSAY